ncbi:MAG: glycosyltransferase [Bacteroidia bacterium]|nr:glycosyltransferase [Bacteroidia bacterium]
MNQPPDILILTDWFAPGYKAGGPIRSCVNLVGLLGDRARLRVLTTDTDAGDTHPYPDIRPDHWIPFGTSHVYYLSRSQMRPARIMRLLRNTQPGCLYINSLFSPWFTLFPLILKRLGLLQVPVVLAPRGMLQAGAMQYKSRKKQLFVSLFRAAGIHRLVRFHATDEQEKQDIHHHLGTKVQVRVIPNIPASPPLRPATLDKTHGVLRCVFVSRISPKKNLDYLLHELKGFTAQLHLDIVGPVEDVEYQSLCEGIISILPPNVSVTWIGPAEPEAVQAYLQGSHIFVLPTHGENFGHAIYEALAAGRPALISDRTPWRGLAAARAGWDIPLETPDAFRAALVTAAAWDQATFDEWSHAAHHLAVTYAQPDTLAQAYLDLFTP